ncbi:hypothetical protein J6590_086121 [Homalodisca vitripennis]|nr:hypothetical protein J6590_086121 [Homalodisca vitripennis]
MIGWPSTYTADPTSDREFCLRTSWCEVDSRRRVCLLTSLCEVDSRRGVCLRTSWCQVESRRGARYGAYAFALYRLFAQQHTEVRRNEQTIQGPVRVNGCGIKISRTTDIKNLFSHAQIITK